MESSFCEKLRSQGLGLFSVGDISAEDGGGDAGGRTFLIMLCVFACKYVHMTQQICFPTGSCLAKRNLLVNCWVATQLHSHKTSHQHLLNTYCIPGISVLSKLGSLLELLFWMFCSVKLNLAYQRTEVRRPKEGGWVPFSFSNMYLNTKHFFPCYLRSALN